MKSRKMRWVRHVAHMGEEECTQGFGKKARRKETTAKA
jgi:hypothetical protein